MIVKCTYIYLTRKMYIININLKRCLSTWPEHLGLKFLIFKPLPSTFSSMAFTFSIQVRYQSINKSRDLLSNTCVIIYPSLNREKSYISVYLEPCWHGNLRTCVNLFYYLGILFSPSR